ncbi:MAG TPA: sodium:calcium antiporter [Candidatus Nanoarchaeia archaeon]|nr:sodium:calcium antiporter [Candidatus Nanoarchaeia archaeon]
MLIVSLIAFLISCLILVVSGSYLVKLLIKISSYLKLSEFIVAFILMAFSTSIPELFVGISSAMKGNPALSLGNVIGANILDLTIIIGIAALLGRGIRVKNPFIKKDSLMILLIASVPVVLMAVGKNLSRIDGMILVAIFIIYITHLFRERRELKTQFKEDNHNHIAFVFLLFIISLTVLFFSANFVVKYAKEMAIELSLPNMLIGLFLVSIGTTLPELVFETRAVLSRKGDLAVGDVMGSVVCNSTLVLGITAIISPITVISFPLFLTSAIFMMIIVFLFTIFIRSKSGLSITESIILILLYILFIIFEFYLKSKIF